MHARRLCLALCATALWACSGSIFDPPRSGAEPPPDTPPDPSGGGIPVGPPPILNAEDVCTETPSVAIAPVRRLTRDEYDATVLELLGDDSAPARAFPPDENLFGFPIGAAISTTLADRYLEAAEALAARAVANLGALLPCDPAATGQDACARDFIRTFGARAYRRPLTTDEEDELFAVYEGAKPLDGFQASIELVVSTVLFSPRFLYRVELGDVAGATPGAVVALGDYEIASRLSYFLWGSMPDAALFDAAASGALGQPADIDAQARRMLADPRAHDALPRFFDGLLDLESVAAVTKDPEVFPEFDDALARSMVEDARRFGSWVLWDSDAKLDTLFRSPVAFVDERLAAVYGAPGITGTAFTRVELDPSERAGILTRPAVMALYSKPYQTSPVHRGRFVRERLLCHTLANPPDGLVVTAPDPDLSATTRERYAEHASDPVCASCHRLTDPIGFGFENYDAIGRYQATDDGFPVDASGTIVETRDADGDFVGAIELADRLARSEQVRDCVATQWMRYALGRVETRDDDCSRARLYESFEASGRDMRELLIAITQSDAFRFKRVDMPAEVAP